MNFKFGRILYIAINLIIGSFFLFIGTYCIVLPLFPFLQSAAVLLILEHTLILSLFGLGFALIGFSIITYAYLNSRRTQVMIRTGKLGVQIDQNIIYQYLDAYWQKEFPGAHVAFQVKVKKRSLKILADLPSLPLNEQKMILEKIKCDFIELFGGVLGYPYEIDIIASFQAPYA